MYAVFSPLQQGSHGFVYREETRCGHPSTKIAQEDREKMENPPKALKPSMKRSWLESQPFVEHDSIGVGDFRRLGCVSSKEGEGEEAEEELLEQREDDGAAGAQHNSHQKKFDSTAMVVPMQGTEKSAIFQSLNSGDHKQCSLVIGRDARAVYNGRLYSSDQFDLTPENVDKVLEDVLPYLIADSGNVDAECLSRTTPFLSSFKILSYVIYLSSSFFNFLFWSAKL
nr:nifU-like protein 1, chloroplastic [Ipomoea batatas]